MDVYSGSAKQPTIGQIIDSAMGAIEGENPSLKGMLPTSYGRPELDKRQLGELVDLISTITVGTKDAKDGDVLGRVYEYFLGEFARNEGKKGGQFYTAKSVVRRAITAYGRFLRGHGNYCLKRHDTLAVC